MKLKSIIAVVAPLLIFGVIVYFLWMGLHRNPRLVPSPLINKPAPSQPFTQKELQGKVTVINVFATWCVACHAEHVLWMEVKNELPDVQFFGIDYKDNQIAVKKWLSEYGNPYQKIIFDTDGQIAVNFGVYGTPETFIIDRQGIIRYKHIGAVTPSVWDRILLPEIKKWQNTN